MAHGPAPWEAALPDSSHPGAPPPTTGSPFLDAMQNPLLLVSHLAALPRHGKQQLWTLQDDQKLIFGYWQHLLDPDAFPAHRVSVSGKSSSQLKSRLHILRSKRGQTPQTPNVAQYLPKHAPPELEYLRDLIIELNDPMLLELRRRRMDDADAQQPAHEPPASAPAPSNASAPAPPASRTATAAPARAGPGHRSGIRFTSTELDLCHAAGDAPQHTPVEAETLAPTDECRPRENQIPFNVLSTASYGARAAAKRGSGPARTRNRAQRARGRDLTDVWPTFGPDLAPSYSE